jgi:predicted glutamine amidotransferase
MCQLLGMNCNTPTDIIFSFEGFAKRGGVTDHHSDGWGIAFFEGRAVRLLIDHKSAVDSPIAQLIKTYPIKSLNVIAHIRKATQGDVNLENSHPFMREMWGQNWVFAHNGNLVNFAPSLAGEFNSIGTTDSEAAFCLMMQQLRRAFPTASALCPPAPQAIHAALAKIVPAIAAFGTFNFCLSNGQAMWAHCSTQLYYIVREYPFSTAHLVDADVAIDFTEHAGRDDRVAVIATQPLTDNEVWHKMCGSELIRFHAGAPQTHSLLAADQN